VLDYNYADPVPRLLTYGESCELWPDYLELGFTKEHIPDLIRMLTDPDLNNPELEGPEFWAPLHAWRTLAQLKAEEALQPLMQLLDEWGWNDWLSEDLPIFCSMIGCAAVPVLEDFLSKEGADPYNRTSISECLQKIAEDHPSCRQDCIDVLIRQLEKYQTNAHFLNGFLAMALADLKALEALELIRAAYKADCVDISILGDLEDAEIIMGVRQSRSTPRPRYHPFPGIPQLNIADYTQELGVEHPVAPEAETGRRKIGRNDPCPCGSGKKYKKCCLH